MHIVLDLVSRASFKKLNIFSIFYVFDMTNPIFQAKANFFLILVS